MPSWKTVRANLQFHIDQHPWATGLTFAAGAALGLIVGAGLGLA